MPIVSYGGAEPAGCDIEFIAEEIEASGVSTRPGNNLGELLSTTEFFDELRQGEPFAVVTLGTSFIQLIFDSDVSQSAFQSFTVEQWGETFVAADADYANTPGVDTFFTWFTNTQEFIEDQQYCVTFIPAESIQVTWALNGDGSFFTEPPPAFATQFTRANTELGPNVLVLAGWSTSFSFPTTSPRTVSYSGGFPVDDESFASMFVMISGGPIDSEPASITYGGVAMSLRSIIDEETEQHIFAAMLPLRDDTPAPVSNQLTITWPAANGFSIRARCAVFTNVSPDSDDFGSGFVVNSDLCDEEGFFSMSAPSSEGAAVITGVRNIIATSTTAPDGFEEAGNSFQGDNPYNVAYLIT